MFEAAEGGHAVSKAVFEKRALRMQADLLAAQRRLREAGVPVVVIVSGVETAGKSEVVKRLNQWLDARSVQSVAFWDESDEERERPAHWRFWRQLPAAGSIAILFGSWYTRPIVDRVQRRNGKTEFAAQLSRINALEQTLADNGALLLKLWFHVSKKEQKRRLREIVDRDKRPLNPYEKAFSKSYDRFRKVSEVALRATDVAHTPWQVVDASDRLYRELEAGRLLLAAMRARLRRAPAVRKLRPAPAVGPAKALAQLDLTAKAAPADYQRDLEKYQGRLGKLSWAARGKKVSTVVVFEGSDAAGKGGAIRRLTAAMDARLFRVIPVAAPTDEERAHHYLWRFWRHIPRHGNFTIYDRSWYGRVLVERVEGFAKTHEWRRAYAEINEFERQLTDDGVCLTKFWLQISPDEQLRRFKEREMAAHKQHKITDEDWRNREKWGAYAKAVDEMIARTSTGYAPWTPVAANDKKYARLEVLKAVCARLEQALDC